MLCSRRQRIRVAVAALLVCGLVAGCARSTNRQPANTTTSLTTPTLAEARAGIEEGYRRNREAYLAKDVKAIMALRTDDFQTVGPDGTVRDRAAMEEYTVGLLNGIDRWIEISFAVDSLVLDGIEADATMRQHLVRMALRPDNKLHDVETWATQRERWRLTADGWKLAKVDQVRDQKRLVDGQPG